jgi:3-hydroxyacyl-CoA dehydrogenase
MNIENIAVIGAGVMGSAIAAQAANAGVKTALLDIVPAGASDRSVIAATALKRLAESDPAPLMHPRNLRLIAPGNIEDHQSLLAAADWIIEAVVERRDIKQSLYRTLDRVRKPGSVVSSNTSTLPLADLLHGLPESFRRDFLITHFFNPPRYMPLIELVAGPDTRPEAVAALGSFVDKRLGKSVVHCKDTPGFIANRIGVYWLQLGILEALRLGLAVEAADAVISKPFGIPKSGVFGLLDLVGLDLVLHVNETMGRTLPSGDPFHAIGGAPEIVQRLVAQGYTGRKGKGGFYRLDRGQGAARVKQAVDLATGEYRASLKPELPAVAAAKVGGPRAVMDCPDPTGRYARSVMLGTLAYAAAIGPDIADDAESIDRALRLGYKWEYGPFELIDRIGADWLAAALEAMGRPVPELLRRNQPMYRTVEGQLHSLAFAPTDDVGRVSTRQGGLKPALPPVLPPGLQPVRRPPGVLLLAEVKRRGPPLARNASASLWDLGDGVLCLEFHGKMNTLDAQVLNLARRALTLVGEGRRALVIHNEAEHFSAGANLGVLMFGANIGLWDEVEKLVGLGQEVYTALKYAPFPVVAAPSGLALGGGCEILLHCAAVQAHAELYMGLVETGVGLVPAWGGCKEMLLRAQADPKAPRGPMAPVARVFETLATATVSKSAQEARDLLFLRPGDGITMNRDRLLYEAKEKALALAEGYAPPAPPALHLPGPSGKAALDLAIGQYRRIGKATAHDAVVAGALAEVLTGGDTDLAAPLTEPDLLALERRAFMALVRQGPTLARVEHMLETGKPLRN